MESVSDVYRTVGIIYSFVVQPTRQLVILFGLIGYFSMSSPTFLPVNENIITVAIYIFKSVVSWGFLRCLIYFFNRYKCSRLAIVPQNGNKRIEINYRTMIMNAVIKRITNKSIESKEKRYKAFCAC